MSKKTDIIVVGVLSAALFTGFTAYSYSADKAKAKAQAKTPVAVAASIKVQTSVDTQPDVAQPVPDATVTNKKPTKTKAS